MLDFKHRLIADTHSENEWQYLVAETKAGEESIVPLLETLLADQTMSSGLRHILTRQLAEESHHVDLYRDLLGRNTSSTGYAAAFSEFVHDLPHLTAKLFAVQTVLESISLGALEYRHQMLATAPSTQVDKIVRDDEEGHVNFGLGFIDELKRRDGVQTIEFFRSVGREANRIFSGHFHGRAISEYFERVFGEVHAAEAIDGSMAMRQFRTMSAQISTHNRVRFLRRYQGEMNVHT